MLRWRYTERRRPGHVLPRGVGLRLRAIVGAAEQRQLQANLAMISFQCVQSLGYPRMNLGRRIGENLIQIVEEFSPCDDD